MAIIGFKTCKRNNACLDSVKTAHQKYECSYSSASQPMSRESYFGGSRNN